MQSLYTEKYEEHFDNVEEYIIDRLPHTLTGLAILCEYLEDNDTSIAGWQTLFHDFDHLMGSQKRKKMIKVMTDAFEPEMIRLLLGENISEDEFFTDEKSMIVQTPKTIDGVQKIIDYLKYNIHCSYGWDIYFDQYDGIATPTQRQYARTILMETFDEHYLEIRYPQVFGE